MRLAPPARAGISLLSEQCLAGSAGRQGKTVDAVQQEGVLSPVGGFVQAVQVVRGSGPSPSEATVSVPGPSLSSCQADDFVPRQELRPGKAQPADRIAVAAEMPVAQRPRLQRNQPVDGGQRFLQLEWRRSGQPDGSIDADPGGFAGQKDATPLGQRGSGGERHVRA